MADFRHEHEAELRIDEIQYTTKQDIKHAYARHLRGDKEARGFLLSILSTHDGEALRSILVFLAPKDRRFATLWLRPARNTLMIMRAMNISQAAEPRLTHAPGNLAKRWVNVYWGIVEYHS